MNMKMPAYFGDGDSDCERIRYGDKDLLVRYFNERGMLQILGFDTKEAPPGGIPANFNVLVEEIPASLKEEIRQFVRDMTGYQNEIRFLQDDSRVFIREAEMSTTAGHRPVA